VKTVLKVSNVSDWNSDIYTIQRQRRAVNKTGVNVPYKFSLEITPSHKNSWGTLVPGLTLNNVKY
jgi:hypothetical protein